VGSCTALWWALISGHADCAKFLIANAAELDNIAYRNKHAYYSAIHKEYYGFDSEIDIDLSNALLAAIWSKNVSCLTLVLPLQQHLLNRSQIKYHGSQTPLSLAVKCDFVTGVGLLIKQGENIAPSQEGYTIIHEAVNEDSLNTLRYLAKNYKHLINTVYTYNVTDDKDDGYVIKQTPLITALFYRHLEAAKVLLELDVNPNVLGQYISYDHNYHGEPDMNKTLLPLKVLLEKQSYELRDLDASLILLLTQQLLHKTKTSLYSQYFLREESLTTWLNYSLLNSASKLNDELVLSITKLLIEHGADVQQKDDYRGNTRLHAIAEVGNTKLMALLIAAEADPFARNKDGQTVIDVAKDKAFLLELIEQHRHCLVNAKAIPQHIFNI
jgi:ankyrin repeat protein